MNELDKVVLPEAAANPEKASDDANLDNVSAACDAAEANNECVETSSPALDLASEADELEDEQHAKRFHAMNKEELLQEMKNIVEQKRINAHKEASSLKQAFFNLRSNEALEELNAYIEAGNAPETFSATPDEKEAEFKKNYALFKEMRASYLKEEEERRMHNLEEKERIIEKLRSISEDIDSINLKFPEFKQLQQDFKDIKDVPASSESEIWKSFQAVVEQFYDHLKMNKELRDLDFKKNLEAKRAIIEAAVALQEQKDVLAAFRALQELHNQWRELGPVAKELRESIWDEFKEASTVINKRHQDYFEKRKEEETANETRKTELCDKLEAILNRDNLTTFAAWDEATKEIIGLQKEWKECGFASRKNNTRLFNRYRKICDDFFEKKTEYYKKTKAEFASNLEKKTALCEQAEALKENEKDLKKAIDRIVKLQEEWRTIGSVPRKQSDSIWKRFNETCNYFFDQRKQINSSRKKEENDNLAVKNEIIAKLKALPLDGVKDEVLAEVKELQKQWQQTGFVPFRMKEKINDEYRAVVDEIYSSFRMREKMQRNSRRGDNGKETAVPADRLQRILEAKRNDLKRYENNLGFFNVKSSAGNSLVKDLQRKIERLQKEIEEVEQKIAEENKNA